MSEMPKIKIGSKLKEVGNGRIQIVLSTGDLELSCDKHDSYIVLRSGLQRTISVTHENGVHISNFLYV